MQHFERRRLHQNKYLVIPTLGKVCIVVLDRELFNNVPKVLRKLLPTPYRQRVSSCDDPWPANRLSPQ